MYLPVSAARLLFLDLLSPALQTFQWQAGLVRIIWDVRREFRSLGWLAAETTYVFATTVNFSSSEN